MLTYETAAVILICVLFIVFTVIAVVIAVVWGLRRSSLGGPHAIKPEYAASVPSGVDAEVIRALSEQLAMIQGKYNAIAPIIEGYGLMSQRMTALETKLPGLVDVIDKLDFTTKNAEKRKMQRDRDQAKRDSRDIDDVGITPEVAYAQMGMDPNDIGSPDAEKVPTPRQQRKGLLKPQNGKG